MSVLWRRKVDGTTYEVRAAGNSIRLYTDCVLHSQWNTKRPLTQSVWDCLTLPGFFLPESKPVNVLMLGVGGGAAVRQIQQFFVPQHIVGIELDPVHIQVANEWFGLEAFDEAAGQGTQIDLIESDAVTWLQNYDGPRFDMVIEDLWCDIGGEAGRAVPMDEEWSDELLRVTNREGILVVNFESRVQMRASGLAEDQPRIRRRYIFEQKHYGNTVGVYTLGERMRRHWRKRVETCEGFDAATRRVALATLVSLSR